MKKITPINTPLNDKDIASLFEAQSLEVPDELKNEIFRQASSQCAENTDSRARDNAISEAAPGTSLPKQNNTTRFWAQGFAVAATIVVVALIAPMMLKEPESTLNRSVEQLLESADAERSPPAALASRADSTPAQTGVVVTGPMAVNEKSDGNISGNIGDSDQQNALVDEVSAQNTLSKQRALSTSTASDSSAVLAHRSTSTKWTEYIESLIADGDVKKAEEEYRLLVQRYPSQAAQFTPDFQPAISEETSSPETN